MLTRLRVKNLALVQQVILDFEPGLNVITGETGAGKSILMGALALVLGERADRSVIRSGEEACGVEALFSLADPAEVDAVLAESGLEPCEEGQMVVRRIIRSSGAGQTLVNDQPVTLAVLRRLGDVLVDMHGPHEHQSLLHAATQLSILDAFAHTRTEQDAYGEPWRQISILRARRRELEVDEGSLAAQMEALEFRVRELDEAGLSQEEEEEIAQEHAIMGNAQRILELAGLLTQALTESDTTAFQQLASLHGALDELSRLLPQAVQWRDEIGAMTSQIQELSATISGCVDDLEVNPARLEWMEGRMALYQRLKRRYGLDVAGLIAERETARAKLEDLSTRREQMADIERQIDALHRQLLQAGEVLGAKRREAAGRLSAAITEELRALGFAHGAFEVRMNTIEPCADGMDETEFAFAPNVGEQMHALRQIASSGEISRVMLAVKAVLARHDRIPVLVFDEIDANLGGEMGHAVGSKLGAVARTHQVICITHLPQVAIHGHHHLGVYKRVREGRTFSEVLALNEDARVEEIARMLGGRDQTSVSLQHAREMLASRATGAQAE